MNRVIAGNWKMNKTRQEAVDFIEKIKDVEDGGNIIIVCVPFTDISAVAKVAKDTDVKVGAQNVHWSETGAFTGEISAKMLLDAGAEYVIIGHSERRQMFGETDETVRMRLKAALSAGLKPIVCLGETLEERESNKTHNVLKNQILKGFAGITPAEMENIIVAYEPIWAIGTGKTATSNDANNTIAYIREVFEAIYGAHLAKNLRLLYGGSMNENNVAELIAMPHIDGGLIGGASLSPEKFRKIIEIAY